MSKGSQEIPEAIKKSLRAVFLELSKGTATLDVYELDLFDWYVRETEELFENMLSAEHAYILGQMDTGIEGINDSGMVAVEYYLKRVRYSHIIYLASLLETFLKRACQALTTVVGTQNLPFAIAELKGDQWTVKRRFLERYGRFTIPNDRWSDIQALISLRNNLVHDNGATNELKPNERNMLTKHLGIKLDGYEVVIEVEYIRSAVEAIKSIVQFVETRISEIVDRAIRPKTVL